MKLNLKGIANILSLFLCIQLLCILPNIIYTLQQHVTFSYVITSVVFSLPIVFLLLLIKNKPVKIILLSFLLIFVLLDTYMVVKYHCYAVSGTILSIVNTNNQEATSMVKNSLDILPCYTLIFLLFTLIVVLVFQDCNEYRKANLILFIVSFFVMIGFVVIKKEISYKGNITYRYYIENRILNRPPYNIMYQIKNAIHITKQEHYIEESKNFTFHASRQSCPLNQEAYVLCIGESMNYDHVSLNNVYGRTTTPLLENSNNVILYSNYYSAGCLTLLSVPQILTRATAIDYGLCYKEKSIIQPYKECDFHVAVIVCHNLLGEKRWMTFGADEFIVVEDDIDIPMKVDSLMSCYDKLFVVSELLGSHFGYYNYTEDFNKYRPNINSDNGVISDSLYINAYDNTILYTDYVLFKTIKALDKPSIISTLMYVSDHGEGIAADGGGHGGNCNPSRLEYHVPLIFWNSDEYDRYYPQKIVNVEKNRTRKVNSDNIFYSVCDMADIAIDSIYMKSGWSIFSDFLQEHDRYVLLPDGVNVKKVD